MKQFSLVGENFFYVLEVVLADVLVSNVLKNFPRQFPKFIPWRMDEVAEISTSAASWSVVVSARNSTVVSRLNDLVWVWWGVRSELGRLDLVLVLEALYSLVGHRHKFFVVH